MMILVFKTLSKALLVIEYLHILFLLKNVCFNKIKFMNIVDFIELYLIFNWNVEFFYSFLFKIEISLFLIRQWCKIRLAVVSHTWELTDRSFCSFWLLVLWRIFVVCYKCKTMNWFNKLGFVLVKIIFSSVKNLFQIIYSRFNRWCFGWTGMASI